MKRVEIMLGGLNCANCAAKINDKVNAKEEIDSARLSMVSKIMVANIKDSCDYNKVIDDIIYIIDDTEPGLDISVMKIRDSLGKHYSYTSGDDSRHINFSNSTIGCECDCMDSCNKGTYSHEEEHRHSHEEEHSHSHGHSHNHGHSHSHDRLGPGLFNMNDFQEMCLAIGLYIVAMIGSKFGLFEPLVYIMMFAAYIIAGRDVLFKAFRNIVKGRVFDENFLMTVATVGAVLIGEYPEAVGVMIFFMVGEYLEDKAVNKSRKNIEALMDIMPNKAILVDGNTTREVDPHDVRVGDRILVRVGDRVALDGKIVKGESRFDTSAITGESVLRHFEEGDSINSGLINKTKAVELEVERIFEDSTVSRIMDMVENASSKKARTENFISVFAKYYTPIVVVLALLLAIVPPLVTGQEFSKWLYRGLVFLVVSCPCALVLSIPLTYFSGIGVLSSRGILVKGSNYIDILKKLDTIVFDKTGTLTKGVFEVSKINIADRIKDKIGVENILTCAYIAELRSNHPIAKSIIEYYNKNVDKKLSIDQLDISEYEEISGGISLVYKGSRILAGNSRLMKTNNIDYIPVEGPATKVYIGVDGEFYGSIEIADQLKDTTKSAIEGLKDIGISKLIMLTGDGKKNAKDFSDKLGMTDYYADLLPDQKVSIVEDLLDKNDPKSEAKLAFVGDGINDAPVIARADIGISMGGLGSDAAIEASDMVIMNDDLMKIKEAINISKYTSRIVIQNIVLAIGIKLAVLILSSVGIANMWMAIFADVGVAVLAVLNSLRVMLYNKY